MTATPSSQPSLRSARSISSSPRAPRLSWPSRKQHDDSDRVCRGRRPGPYRFGVKPGAAGGNVTGLSNLQTDLGGRRLELLSEVVPGLKRVAILGNVDSPLIALEMEGVEAAAKKLGLDAFRLEVRKAEDIVPSIEGLKGAADALYVCSDPFLTTHRVRINTLAVSQKLPTMNAFREYVVAGGLMSYGPNFPDLFRRSGDYVDKILRGAKPADIPVEQPLKFNLVINTTTAKALGLTIPESFLLLANEVIE